MSNQAVALYRGFENELTRRMDDDLCNMLPDEVSPDKWRSAALMAVKVNDGLLKADRRSLHNAITFAALDGLLPDGRQAAIVPYKGKATYMPMARGIRDRAGKYGMTIETRIAYENDKKFEVRYGDDPGIDHVPFIGATKKRGDPVAAYAIFRKDGQMIHFEVMSVDEIEQVRSVSMAKNSPMWSQWWDEAAKKSVLRRGIKSCPMVDERISRMVERGQAEEFPQFNKPQHDEGKVIRIADAVPSPEQHDVREELHSEAPMGDFEEAEIIDGLPPIEESVGEGGPIEPLEAEDAAADPNQLLEDFITALNLTKSLKAAEQIWNRFEERMPADDAAFCKIYEEHTDGL